MTYNLTQGSIIKNIIKFSLPFFFSYFLQTLYGMADLFIAGQYNESNVISAVAIGSQIMHMITVIIVGLATGTTVMISKCVGSGTTKKVSEISQIIGNTIITFTFVAIVFTTTLLICNSLVIKAMSVPLESIAETKKYLTICFAGIPFIVAYNVLSSIFRGLGDSKSPLIFVAITCTLNIVLDIFFMGLLKMGAAGAAYGTILAQATSVIIAIAGIRKEKNEMAMTNLGTNKRNDLSLNKHLQYKMLGIGFPIAVQDGFIQISFLIITIIANRRGVTVAAAVGIVEKVISFLFLVPSSMLSAVSAISAQNIGAGFHDRAKKTLAAGCSISAGIGLIFALVFQFASYPFLSLFTHDKDVVELGTQYLKTYVFDCVFAGIHFPFGGFFSAYSRSMLSFIHNFISIIFVRIPGAYFSALLFPSTLYAMGLAAPAGSMISVIICFVFYAIISRKGGFDK